MKKIVVIDGQGGKLGQAVVEAIQNASLSCETYAIGTNSIATAAMLKAGADYGATGENPTVVACRDADVMGPGEKGRPETDKGRLTGVEKG